MAQSPGNVVGLEWSVNGDFWEDTSGVGPIEGPGGSPGDRTMLWRERLLASLFRDIFGQLHASRLFQKSVFCYFVDYARSARYPQDAPSKGECTVRAQFNHSGHQVVEPRLLTEVDQRRDASATEADHLSDRRTLRDGEDGRRPRDERRYGHEAGRLTIRHLN